MLERQGLTLHLMEAGGHCMEPRRIQQLLVQLEQSLRMSTMVTTQQGLTEDQAGQGQGDSDHAVLAERAL
ncbi:hypothetical protein BG003_002987, partial [Podila horticola]